MGPRLFHRITTTAADELATQGAEASAAMTWIKSRKCGCLVTWFCYELIAKPGNKTATIPMTRPNIELSQNIPVSAPNGLNTVVYFFVNLYKQVNKLPISK